jgi:hypothetical protein
MIDILLPPKLAYKYLSDSRLFTWLWQISCNHYFLGGIIQTGDLNIMGGFQAIQLKNCKNRVRKLVNKRREESVKGLSSIILSRNILRMTSDRNCLVKHRYCQSSWSKKDVDQSNHFCYEFCHSAFCFGITSHPSTKHVFSLFLCRSEVRRCLKFHFWQKKQFFWLNSNTQD